MRLLNTITLILLTLQSLAQTANPNADNTTKQVLQYHVDLKSAPDNNILIGQNIGHGTEMYTYINTLVNDLQQQTGKFVGMIGADYGLDPNIDYTQSNQILIDYWNAGGLITLSWTHNNPWTGGNVWDTNNSENLYDLITPGNPAYTVWQNELQLLGNVLQELENAGVTVLWRPLHEMNGFWFWWGEKNFAGHEQAYIDVWRDMFNYLTYTRGLDNLLWVFSAADTYNQLLLNYYPGAAYVDITGIDIYNDNVDTYFPSRDYQDLQSLGHPMGLNEFGPTLSTANGNFDYRTLITNMKLKYPDMVFAHVWHNWYENGNLVAVSMTENQFASQMLADPCVVTRDEIVLTPPPVNCNLIENSDFDIDFSGWFFNANSGAVGTQYFDTQNPHNGAQSACVDITNGGIDTWNVQLLPSTVSVNAGDTYSLSFHARADINNKLLIVDFRDTNGNVWQDGTTFNLTTNWARYDFSFTAPNTVNSLSVDFNMGGQSGVYCFDDILLEIPTSPTGPCSSTCVPIDLKIWLEGVYDPVADSMTTELYNMALLPAGQPYNTAPWNYPGTEGNGWTINDYPPGTVDWVLLSFRTALSPSFTVFRKAALLLSDGSIVFADGCIERSELINTYLFVVVEHRNHIGVMTALLQDNTNWWMTYDFTAQDGYTSNGSGTGQKEITPGNWALIAGDIDQSDTPSYDVNAGDKTIWAVDNGLFNIYKGSDVNLDGDVNGLDRILWQYNSGIFSVVPR